MKRNRKIVSILLTLSLLVTLLLPMATPAAAAGLTNNYVDKEINVADDLATATFGSLYIKEDADFGDTFPAPATGTPAQITLTLVDGVEFPNATDTLGEYIDAAATTDSVESNMSIISRISTSVTFAVYDAANTASQIKFVFNSLEIDSSFTGAVKVRVDSLDSSVTSGEYTIGSVLGTECVATVVNKKDVSVGATDQTLGTIRITENAAGALVDGEAIVITLPDDYTWAVPYVALSGSLKSMVKSISASSDIDGEALTLHIDRSLLPGFTGRGILDITPIVDVPYDAEAGDIEVTVKGNSTNNIPYTTLVVGKVNVGSVTVTVLWECFIGRVYESPEIKIIESSAGSLVNSHESLVFNLPTGFTWDISNVTANLDYGDAGMIPNKSDFSLSENNQILKVSIPKGSNQCTAISISGLKINVDMSMIRGPSLVKCDIAGLSNVSISSINVGKYIPIMSTDPVNGSSGVPINKNISVTYGENIQAGNNAPGINVSNNNNSVLINYGINGSALTIYPQNHLDYSVTYTVYIPHDALRDIQGGELPSYSFSFTTVSSCGSTGGGSGGGGGSSTQSQGKTVSTEGGLVNESNVTITVPAGAVPSDIKVKVKKLLDTSNIPIANNTKLVSDVLEITKDKSGNFTKPVIITLTFEESKLDTDKYNVSIFWFDEDAQKWVELKNVKVDLEAGKVSGEIEHFTKFAVLAVEKPVEPVVQKNIVNLKDISGHWAEAAIKNLVESGTISGYPDGTFRPNEEITRAEFITMLVKAYKLNSQGGKVFTDTAAHWAKDAIETGWTHGVIMGYSENTFGPNDPITREQMAVMIAKAAKLASVKEKASFSDSKLISSWAEDAINTATKIGIIRGFPGGTYQPQNHATRAESVSVIVNTLKR